MRIFPCKSEFVSASHLSAWFDFSFHPECAGLRASRAMETILSEETALRMSIC
jgi:hypothetical protein